MSKLIVGGQPMLFRELKASEYDAFARKHANRHFLNSKNAFIVKQKAGFSCFFVGIEEDKKIIAACGIVLIPYLRFFKYAYAQRGFLIDYNNRPLLSFFVKELTYFLLRKHVIYLKMDPFIEYQKRDQEGNVIGKSNRNDLILTLSYLGFLHQGFYKGFKEDAQCRFMCILDLKEKNEKQLLEEMSSQTRWSIQKSQRLGIKVRELEEEELSLFKGIMDETAMRKHFVDMCFDTYKRQIKVYGKENAKILMSYMDLEDFKIRLEKQKKIEEEKLLEVETLLSKQPFSKKYLKRKKVILENLEHIHIQYQEWEELRKTYDKEVPLSVAYFIFYEDEVIYVSSGSIPSLKKYLGPYAIQWHTMKEAMQRDITKYNFYGTSGDFSKNAIDYGVYHFKKGFNAYPIELIGEFILPIQSKRYKILDTIYKCINK